MKLERGNDIPHEKETWKDPWMPIFQEEMFCMIHCELLILKVRIYYSAIACKPTMSVSTLIQPERGISHLNSKSAESRNDTNWHCAGNMRCNSDEPKCWYFSMELYSFCKCLLIIYHFGVLNYTFLCVPACRIEAAYSVKLKSNLSRTCDINLCHLKRMCNLLFHSKVRIQFWIFQCENSECECPKELLLFLS